MSLLGNLSKIVTAPIVVIDETVLKPFADLADMAVEGLTGKERDE